MTIMFTSATAPINPSGASPVLTMEHIWKAMELKVRKPQIFLAPVAGCEVLEDTNDHVLRVMKFKPGMGSPVDQVREKITHCRPINNQAGAAMETFTSLDDSTRVLNIISQGPSGADEDLFLTFTLEWDVPGETETAVKRQADFQKVTVKSVSEVIVKTRELVSKGEL